MTDGKGRGGAFSTKNIVKSGMILNRDVPFYAPFFSVKKKKKGYFLGGLSIPSGPLSGRFYFIWAFSFLS